jgi:quercetin dioxygenase-like cupin family protein
MIRVALVAAAFAVISPAAIAMDEHLTLSPDELKWVSAPPAFPKGLQMAILAGDPSKEGMYVIRLKAPAGYRILPHTHPFDENVTVVSGSSLLKWATKSEK